MKGVGFDLGQALARRMGVPFELVLSPSVGALLDGAKSGAWDVTFMAVNPAREKDVDFTAPHLEVEFGYLIPGDSSLATLADVDRHGSRVAVVEGGQWISCFLARSQMPSWSEEGLPSWRIRDAEIRESRRTCQ